MARLGAGSGRPGRNSDKMIANGTSKSSDLGAVEASATGTPGTVKGRFPIYGILGLAAMIAGEILLFSGNRAIGTHFTPFQWTGYILFMDGLVKKRKGTSLLSDHAAEFFLLCVISIGSWLIFEGYNLLLRNWTYTGLPESTLPRYMGYAWSFATISPAIFLTYELLESLFPVRSESGFGHASMGDMTFWIVVILGFVMLVVPLAYPSPYMTPLVWIGFVLFLDPINGRMGERSILAEFASGRRTPLVLLFASGLVCGLLWEFWNYWALAKWNYSVPYFSDVKLFEMPVVGYLGFPPFAIECFAIYKFVRRLLPIPIGVRYLG